MGITVKIFLVASACITFFVLVSFDTKTSSVFSHSARISWKSARVESYASDEQRITIDLENNRDSLGISDVVDRILVEEDSSIDVDSQTDLHLNEKKYVNMTQSDEYHLRRNLQSTLDKKVKRCGGSDHSSLTRPCSYDDSLCGHWKNRYWYPSSCEYRDITADEAKKCLGKRTLAFIGDSQMRDIALGVVRFLQGETLEQSSDNRVQGNWKFHNNAVMIPYFNHWQHNVNGVYHQQNGYIFPKPEEAKQQGIKWQVQIWMLYRNEFIVDQVNQVLNNKMPAKFPALNSIDLAFWSHGLHDYGWFLHPPHGERYYEQVVRKWKDIRTKVLVPTVWVSQNPECTEVMNEVITQHNKQADIIEEVLRYTNKKLLESRLPYWDAGAVLRSKERCSVSADGVHVRMYVDIMRAKMLFNHLCDENMNWKGSDNAFK